MNISEAFIRRPVATALLQISIVIFGIMGYRSLPVSDLPPIDFPTISVNASLPGANPETMAAAVATPLEKQFSALPGITSISSTKRSGVHEHHAAVRSRSRHRRRRAGRAGGHFAHHADRCRTTCRRPPSFQKVNPADSPIMFLTLSSPTLPLSQINEYAEGHVGQRFRR
jgi:HAE1 family hydrophobic/amphiphilic exporter-1